MPADGNSPQLVDAPRMFPGSCVDGSQGEPGVPVIDTGWEFGDGMHVYLSVKQTKMYGRLVGMVDAAAYAEVEESRDAERKLRVAAETELADARPFLDRLAKVAERYGGDE